MTGGLMCEGESFDDFLAINNRSIWALWFI